MQPLVLEDIGAVPEGLAALATSIGLLPRVHATMLGEVGALAEGLLAVTAFVRLLPMV